MNEDSIFFILKIRLIRFASRYLALLLFTSKRHITNQRPIVNAGESASLLRAQSIKPAAAVSRRFKQYEQRHH